MKTVYNSHIVKFKDITIGSGAIDTQVSKLRPTIIKLRGVDGSVVEIQAGKWRGESNHPQPFEVVEVEMVTRNPPSRPSYLSDHDLNRLYWGRERGSGTAIKNPARGSPMFFRENGAAVDLIDSQRGACFLVLNGPSTATLNTSLLGLPGIASFGVNNGSHKVRTTYWTCVDDPKRFMSSIWADPKITKFVPMHHFAKPIWDTKSGCAGSLVREFPAVFGFRRNERFLASQFLTEDTINWGNHGDLGGGRSCMLVALRIIHLLGFRRVYLLGCDFHMSDSEKYFFDEKRTKGAIAGNNSSYKIMMGYYEALAPVFNADGFMVFNCNKDSNLKVFPYADYYEAIAEHAIDTNDTTDGMYVDRDSDRRKS